jgi:2-oxoglutarate/2-oxoacid ferredoxin oxidoreductase subunit beta
MEKEFLTKDPLPFCKGCGHTLISQNTEKAFRKLNYNHTDVILVTDIGCHGIIDKSFLTHTVHGLHGRSVALASGISIGVHGQGKKVIVFMGDGSATIGMQHLIDSAHNNDDMTVVIHNNMLYGMTGGQPSEFTPRGFKTPTLQNGAVRDCYDVCELVAAAGASYVRRITGIGDFSEELAEAFSRKGFSLVEVMEICPSYAVKANPGFKLKDITQNAGLHSKVYVDREIPVYEAKISSNSKSLVDAEIFIEQKFNVTLNTPKKIMFAGSAGEGVQVAAELLARAAISCGLYATKKGSYPVTVGIGYSASQIILSPEEIVYTGFEYPDIMIITSQDGLDFASGMIRKMDENSFIFIQSGLTIENCRASIVYQDFRTDIPSKNVSLYAIYQFLIQSQILPAEAIILAVTSSKIGEKTDIGKLFRIVLPDSSGKV